MTCAYNNQHCKDSLKQYINRIELRKKSAFAVCFTMALNKVTAFLLVFLVATLVIDTEGAFGKGGGGKGGGGGGGGGGKKGGGKYRGKFFFEL